LQDGVILGADTRATERPIVCDKNCEKIHYMAPNIYCCGAGTAADTEAVTGTVNMSFVFDGCDLVLSPVKNSLISSIKFEPDSPFCFLRIKIQYLSNPSLNGFA